MIWDVEKVRPTDETKLSVDYEYSWTNHVSVAPTHNFKRTEIQRRKMCVNKKHWHLSAKMCGKGNWTRLTATLSNLMRLYKSSRQKKQQRWMDENKTTLLFLLLKRNESGLKLSCGPEKATEVCMKPGIWGFQFKSVNGKTSLYRQKVNSLLYMCSFNTWVILENSSVSYWD